MRLQAFLVLNKNWFRIKFFQPLIEWMVDGVVFVSNDGRPSNGRFEIQPNGDLVINDVMLEDDYYYKCKASNKAGYDTARISLNVMMRPVIFKKWPDPLPVEGANVTLECEARGVPKPEVSWYLDDEAVYSR